MDKKRIARRVLLAIFAVIFVLILINEIVGFVQMYTDRVYVFYQGELYQAHDQFGRIDIVPKDAQYIGEARHVEGGKKKLKADLETTARGEVLTVYRSASDPEVLYLKGKYHIVEDIWALQKE